MNECLYDSSASLKHLLKRLFKLEDLALHLAKWKSDPMWVDGGGCAVVPIEDEMIYA